MLEGEAELTYASGKRVRLIKGDSLLLPARRRHRVSCTSSPCIWLCVFGEIEEK